MSARNGTNNRRKGAHTQLANIVRQETRDGKLIVRFLVDAMQGDLDGAKPHHRLDAARQLLTIGFDGAQAFIDRNAPDAQLRAAAGSRAANDDNRRLDPKLAKLIRQQTDNGKTAVRFLVDVMQGKLPDFKPHHRLAAARELLHRGFYDDRDEDPGEYHRDRRPARRPQGTAKTTPRNPEDDSRNGRSPLAELELTKRGLIEKRYGSEDTFKKTVENTVRGEIEFEDRETFEDLPDHQLEALVQEYGSPEAWFAAVAKFANAEATLDQLLSGSIDPDDTTNANTDDGDRRDDPHADDSYAPQEEPPPEEPPPEDDEHRPDPGEPSIWDLKAANRVLDSTTQMEYHRSYW